MTIHDLGPSDTRYVASTVLPPQELQLEQAKDEEMTHQEEQRRREYAEKRRKKLESIGMGSWSNHMDDHFKAHRTR
jgi:hypothetical protein